MQMKLVSTFGNSEFAFFIDAINIEKFDVLFRTARSEAKELSRISTVSDNPKRLFQ